MILYHGTSLTNWKKIKKQGAILPRNLSKVSNWDHSVQSNGDTVYLTDSYAMHFGLSAIQGDQKKFEDVVIIEIDVDDEMLPNMVPDEDALEQVGKISQDDLPSEWNMYQRTEYYRQKAHEYAKTELNFEWSLKALGTCGHVGKIDIKHVTRVARIDIKKESALTWSYMDCQVSVKNYRFLGPHWRQMSKRIFGDNYVTDPNDVIVDFYKVPAIGDGIKIIQVRK
jgi:hypothetical protein